MRALKKLMSSSHLARRAQSNSGSDSDSSASASASSSDSSSFVRRSTRNGTGAGHQQQSYLKPKDTDNAYHWEELELSDVPGKNGQGVRANVDLPKGTCLVVFGNELADYPYPENTTHIIESGRKGFLIDMDQRHEQSRNRWLFIAGKVCVALFPV